MAASPLLCRSRSICPAFCRSSLPALFWRSPVPSRRLCRWNTEGLLYKFLSIFNYNTGWYAMIYILLIIMFNYFYVAIQYNPVEMANNLQKNNGAIPGIRPGRPTTEFITKVISKITLVGALFLGLVATFADSAHCHHRHEHFAGRYLHPDRCRRCAGYGTSAGVRNDDASLQRLPGIMEGRI